MYIQRLYEQNDREKEGTIFEKEDILEKGRQDNLFN